VTDAGTEDRDQPLAELAALHHRVDAEAGALARRHAGRLRCRRGCAGCCHDGLTVFAVEAERIRAAHRALLREEAPHAPGACAFLHADGACRIYAERPYVCRTQGLPLRWHEPGPDGRVVERRDICPENEPGPPLLALSPDACWRLGPAEAELAAIARRFDPGAERIPLRALFARDDPGAAAGEPGDDPDAVSRRGSS